MGRLYSHRLTTEAQTFCMSLLISATKGRTRSWSSSCAAASTGPFQKIE